MKAVIDRIIAHRENFSDTVVLFAIALSGAAAIGHALRFAWAMLDRALTL